MRHRVQILARALGGTVAKNPSGRFVLKGAALPCRPACPPQLSIGKTASQLLLLNSMCQLLPTSRTRNMPFLKHLATLCMHAAVEQLRFEVALRGGAQALPAALRDAGGCRVLESHGDQART